MHAGSWEPLGAHPLPGHRCPQPQLYRASNSRNYWKTVREEILGGRLKEVQALQPSPQAFIVLFSSFANPLSIYLTQPF